MCTPFGKMQNDFHDARVVGGSPSLCEHCMSIVSKSCVELKREKGTM